MRKISNINILVLGSGGREHSICDLLYKSDRIKNIYCCPGNAGIAKVSKQTKINVNDFDSIVKFCKKNKIDMVIPGSEVFLEKGISDYLQLEGISVIGPSKFASLLESSKLFTKKICDLSSIKTAKWFACVNAKEAKDHITKMKFPLVIKMDSLASGKGVCVTKNLKEANDFLDNIIIGKLGNSESKIILEECLFGEEGSFFFAVDGTEIKFLGSAKDYKRASEGNKGLNTGGMGCISPSPKENRKVILTITKEIIKPTLKAMNDLGYPFSGFLYAGVMFTKRGIYLIEFNVRLGDPECQAVLNRLKTNFLDICLAIKNKKLKSLKIKKTKDVAVCIVLASQGYPEKYSKGIEIFGINSFKNKENLKVYHAGTKKDQKGKFLTNSGRVINIICLDKKMNNALDLAYDICNKIYWKGYFFRRDIGS